MIGKTYNIKKAAEILNVHEDTLRNWEEQGLIKPLRVGKRQDRKYTDEILSEAVKKGLATPFIDLNSDLEENKKTLTLAQLETFLWKSADILRGKIDSSDYKKYIFGLLFYKRMSDVWDEEFNAVMKEYDDKDIARADYNHRFQVPKDCRWEKITEQAENIGQKLNDIFDKLTNANSPKLDKIFDDLDFANKDRFPNETLQRLINHFSQYNFGNTYISSDLLGDAYEYLIKQFAADAGKKGGEFYTPREVEKVIVGILKPHQKDHIYDPTVGSGGFLLEAYDYLKAKSGEKIAKSLYLYGQEQNLSTFAIARINMFLHGLDSADIRRGDTLSNPQFLNQQGGLQTFDIVVANPPYSIKDYEWESFKNKFGRVDGYDVPPEKNADYAFVLHIIKSMNANGRAGIVLPHGVLTRGGAEGRIREQLIKNDLIEGIIALPPKLFYGTVNPAVILILNKNKSANRQQKVFIIDGENDFLEGKNQNVLHPKNIEKIVNAYESFSDIEKYSRSVGIDEFIKNEYNLNIRRYVSSLDEEERIDISKTIKEVGVFQVEFARITKESTGFVLSLLSEFSGSKQKNLPKGWSVKKIDDIAYVSTGGTPSTQKKEYWNGDISWMSSGEVNLRRVRGTEKKITQLGLKNCNSEIFPVETVMIALAGQGSTRGKVAILEIPTACNQSLAALRSKNTDYILNAYLFYNLEYRYQELRNINGSAGRAGLNLKLIKDLPIVVPPLEEQEKIVSTLSLIDQDMEVIERLKAKFTKLKKGIGQNVFQNKK